MSTALRWISVDDTSADVRYIGDSWFAEKGSLDAIGSNGPPFLSTLHGTNSSASFTFNFSGSGLRVMGTYTGTQNSSTMDWTCFVDGISMGKTVPGTEFNENHRMFCQFYPMTDGPHTITVDTTVGSNQTFWFDKIQYLPSASVSLENKTIQLDSGDSAILYGSGWSAYSTHTNGSQMGCNFYGLSVSWYATETSGNSTTGTWAIDDNSPTTFVLNGRGSNDTPEYNIKYFETPQYSMGSHKLAVTYNGDNSTTPLILAYLVVQNGTLPHPTNSSSQAANTTSASSSSSSSSTTETGSIIGGAVGGVAGLLLIIFLFFYRYRRRTEIHKRAVIDASPIPVPSSPLAVSAFSSYQTRQKGPAVSPLANVPTAGHVPSTQDGLSKERISPVVTISYDPSRLEQDHSHRLSNTQLSSPSGPIGPSGFVGHQDGGWDIRQELRAPDAPPAYSAS